MRHGESTANFNKTIAGHIDAPLTELGEEQARQAARDVLNQGIVFDIIVSSPLSRALDKARILANILNIPQDSIITNKLFIERFGGALEGQLINTRAGLTDKDLDSYGVESKKNLPNAQQLVLTGFKHSLLAKS